MSPGLQKWSPFDDIKRGKRTRTVNDSSCQRNPLDFHLDQGFISLLLTLRERCTVASRMAAQASRGRLSSARSSNVRLDTSTERVKRCFSSGQQRSREGLAVFRNWTAVGMKHDSFETANLKATRVRTLAACSPYLGQVLVGQKMQFSRFEAILTFAFVEEVGLEFSAGGFFGGRHGA